MHVVFFADQHLGSLGGAQVSMRLQRKFLERAGHTVTVVAPAMHGALRRTLLGTGGGAAAGDIDLPSIPVTPDREYSFTWPGARTDRFVDAAMKTRPPVDIVHVQADFWGAFIGHRFARRHGLPVVHTMHNRVDVGIRAVSPVPGLTLRALNMWQRAALPPLPDGAVPRAADGWSYLAGLAAGAAAVTAPSHHFARRLEVHGVYPAVDVVWNGIDDEILDEVLPAASAPRRPGRPRFIWLGRMSPEKRLLPFLEAVAHADLPVDVHVLGGGAQLRAARRLIAKRRPAASVTFGGRLPYPDTLRRIAEADALVQTSIGFETQGMTPFEAASLGTPSVISDPDIAAELGSGFWAVPDGSVPALAETLRRAAADIAAGTPVAVDPRVREEFRQSSRTEAMLRIYERVRA